jgi:hypothetical protein
MTTASKTTLLTAGAATGAAHRWPGGLSGFLIDGTWDGATASLQISRTGTANWVAVDSSSFTADGGASFALPNDIYVRVLIGGAGAGTSLNAILSIVGAG